MNEFRPEYPGAPNNGAQPPLRHRRRHSIFWLILLVIICGIILVWHLISSHNAAAKQRAANLAKRPIPVVVSAARSSDVPVYIPALGAVTSIDTVTVKTQINGQLIRVLFKEGQLVKTGQLLAQIDPRPFLAQLTQFEGQLAHDQALLDNARIDLKRYIALYPQGAVSQQTYETQKWLVKQLEGTVQVDQGQIDAVKLNLIYCNITSPIDGRVGLRLVDPGNFVQTSDTTGLFVLNIVQPITVVFSIPEDDIPQILQQSGKPLPVEAYDRTQNTLLATGTLLTIDNQVDQTTGTIKLKAQFQNENNHLFPDQFVNVNLLINTLHNATVVPTAAVQYGSKGTFVFVVNSNQTASIKAVTVGPTMGNDITISTGVLPGQSVVVQGADKLIDGSPVTPTSDPTLSINLPLPVHNNPKASGAGS